MITYKHRLYSNQYYLLLIFRLFAIVFKQSDNIKGGLQRLVNLIFN